LANICIHQPNFLPWVGFWNKLAQCETHVSLDAVDFAPRDYQNRVMLNGSWMTLSIDNSTRHHPIKDVVLADYSQTTKAAERIRNTLQVKKYKYGNRLNNIVEYLEITQQRSLCSINHYLIMEVIKLLGMKKPNLYVKYKERPKKELTKTGNTVHYVQFYAPSNSVYYSGAGGLNYLDKAELPFPVKVQRMKPGIKGDSILQSIATEPDPIDYVMSAATWENFNV
jgi:hypothetical protein